MKHNDTLTRETDELIKKVAEQDKRIIELEKDKEKSKKKEKHFLTNKALQKVIFWGAIASAIHALIALGQLITSWFKN